MNTVQLSTARLDELVGRFSECRIAVIGDFFLDKYLDVNPGLAEVSLETGKTAHQVVAIHCSPGAAGTVVCNLAALGAGRLHAIGFAGEDGEGYDLRKELTRLNCSTEHLHPAIDRHTPTYLKPRDTNLSGLDAEHARYDTKNRDLTPATMEDSIIQSLDQLLADLDAVVLLDQVEEPDCGVITRRVRDTLAERAANSEQIVFWADSRRRIREFSGMIVKPNQFETVGQEQPLPGDEVDLEELVAAARRLRAKNRAPVVVTRGARGMLVSDPRFTQVPGVPVKGPIDPTGAGDSVTAGTVLALCAGATLPEAALIGNLIASLTIQQLGTTGVATPEQLAGQLDVWRCS